jgi:YidC/Oxa1 family membrane protein insertase
MISTYFGAAVSSPANRYQKIAFKDMQEKNFAETIQGGWAAMVQHYFVGAWIPPNTQSYDYYSKVTPNKLYVIGFVGPAVSISPHNSAVFNVKLYLGPAIAKYLEAAAPGLKLTIDYGWFWFIADIIFWMMEGIYKVVGNWGLAIILVTVIIKALFYYLSAKSYRSMSALKQLQPRIEMLKQQFGDDKQKLTQATLELYRHEKVNPMSGCLPILVQIPVFIALYWVLVENVQFRQAPFYFWIHDLSQSDPYYVLPILMGLSLFLQQRLNPPPPDPMQAKVMMLMPVIFTALFFNFPSGLMLYWIVNNTLSFLQQWYIMKQYHPEKHHTHTKHATSG